jgi:hypothetical protein
MKTRYRATLHLFSGNYSLATISNYLALTQVEHRGSWIICTLDMTIGQEIPYTRSRLILIAAPARRVHSRDFCLLRSPHRGKAQTFARIRFRSSTLGERRP